MDLRNVTVGNIKGNARVMQSEMNWLSEVMEARADRYFKREERYENIYQVPAPKVFANESIYSDIVIHYNMNLRERLVLLLALAPHICPQILDIFYTKNEVYGRGYSQFGGQHASVHSGFLPTGETAAFLIAGDNLAERFRLLSIFDPDHFFVTQGILTLNKDKTNEPMLTGALVVGKEYLSFFTSGMPYKPTFSSEFPASKITTKLNWNDLVLEGHTLDEIDEIHNWLKHSNTLMYDWGLLKQLKPGFRTLFYGPPGTGKTLTASLLGKSTDLDVYRVDLSKVVSKYIGETEKNMANIFDQAENKNWILFFDEADALFGKRSATSDSKDRYANQEVAYLLQRVEDFNGVVILASNLRSNIDDAFARRFQSMVFFPMPRPKQRLRLWKNAFREFKLGPEVDLWQIAKDHEMAGGAVINVLRYTALMAVVRGERVIHNEDILEGIRKEFKKEGKTV